jgi:hypothetical protein
MIEKSESEGGHNEMEKEEISDEELDTKFIDYEK